MNLISEFLSGVIFKKSYTKKSKLSLSIFGFFTTFILYGGIMNSSSVILAQQSPTLNMFLAAYASGAAFELVHATSTAFFLWLISDTMIDILRRIKIKYGLVTDNDF